MSKKRRGSIHLEGTVKFQHGDDIQRWRKWGREGCMDTGVEDEERDVAAHAQELGCKLAKQHRSPKPKALFQAHLG